MLHSYSWIQWIKTIFVDIAVRIDATTAPYSIITIFRQLHFKSFIKKAFPVAILRIHLTIPSQYWWICLLNNWWHIYIMKNKIDWNAPYLHLHSWNFICCFFYQMHAQEVFDRSIIAILLKKAPEVEVTFLGYDLTYHFSHVFRQNYISREYSQHYYCINYSTRSSTVE
jgi:hypothetical protein